MSVRVYIFQFGEIREPKVCSLNRGVSQHVLDLSQIRVHFLGCPDLRVNSWWQRVCLCSKVIVIIFVWYLQAWLPQIKKYKIKRRSSSTGARGGGKDVWAWRAAPPPCWVGGTGGGCLLGLRLCGCCYVKVKPRQRSCEETCCKRLVNAGLHEANWRC